MINISEMEVNTMSNCSANIDIEGGGTLPDNGETGSPEDGRAKDFYNYWDVDCWS